MDKVRDTVNFQIGKTEYVPREICEDFNMEDQQFFDLPSIKRTIHSLQEKVKEISLNSSVQVDINESKDRDDGLHEKLGSAICQL